MNLRIIDEIADADARAGNCLRALSLEESKKVRNELAARYGCGDGQPFTYQTISGTDGFRSNDGWRLIPEFIGTGEVLFFLNPDQTLTVWRCPSAKWLTELLADCFGFPFYAASTDLESLFCFDDHDCVLVGGRALAQIAILKPPTPD